MAVIIEQTDIDTLYTEMLAAAGGAVKAAGTITFAGQPANNDTITFNGTVVTFKTSGAVGSEVNIGADLATTISDLADFLNASANGNIDDATYTAGATTLSILHDTAGAGGNAYTLAKSGANITLTSGATLAGGAATGATGRFNADDAINTSTQPNAVEGEVVAVRANQTFEDNSIAVMAMIEFIIENLANPATSNTTLVQSRQQRKLLKDVLQALSAEVSSGVDSTTDTREDDAARVRAAGVAEFNKAYRSTSL